MAAACVVPEHVDIAGMDDSKKLSAQQREALYAQLTGHPDVLWAACVVEAEEIDAINILQAALKAMEGAAAGLTAQPDFLLVDGNRLPKVRAAMCVREAGAAVGASAVAPGGRPPTAAAALLASACRRALTRSAPAPSSRATASRTALRLPA